MYMPVAETEKELRALFKKLRALARAVCHFLTCHGVGVAADGSLRNGGRCAGSLFITRGR